ncbi:MAG: OmpA family protein [Candidatus Latescibacterota bacterium]|jgi:chemotaxis protein MotB
MRTGLIITLTVLIVPGLLLTGCSNKKLIEQKDAQISALQDELDGLETQLADEKSKNAKLKSDLDNALSDLRTKEQVWMQEKEGLMEITLDGEVTFASGSTRLTSAGKDILNRIWDVLQNYPGRDIMIEGHTDNVPISPQFQDNYRSNWELSSARANSVLHYVLDKYGVDASRISAVGYGEYRPIASNETDDGRRMNRRVVITVGPSSTNALP